MSPPVPTGPARSPSAPRRPIPRPVEAPKTEEPWGGAAKPGLAQEPLPPTHARGGGAWVRTTERSRGLGAPRGVGAGGRLICSHKLWGLTGQDSRARCPTPADFESWVDSSGVPRLPSPAQCSPAQRGQVEWHPSPPVPPRGALPLTPRRRRSPTPPTANSGAGAKS